MGSRVVISGIISPLMGVITIVILIRTPLITTHEPPSGGGLAVTARFKENRVLNVEGLGH